MEVHFPSQPKSAHFNIGSDPSVDLDLDPSPSLWIQFRIRAKTHVVYPDVQST